MTLCRLFNYQFFNEIATRYDKNKLRMVYDVNVLCNLCYQSQYICIYFLCKKWLFQVFKKRHFDFLFQNTRYDIIIL